MPKKVQNTVPPPPTHLLKGQDFLWDRGPVRHLWSVASPAPGSTYLNLGRSPKNDEEVYNVTNQRTLDGKVTILRASYLAGFADWESGVLASAAMSTEGEVTDAYKRGTTYESDQDYKPYTFSVEDALTREGIWELDAPNGREPYGTIGQLSALWPDHSLLVDSHFGTKVTKEQFWTNIRLGLGGTSSRIVPYTTVQRVIYGTQYVFWNEFDWTSEIPESPTRATKPDSPKRRKLMHETGRAKRYAELCGHMGNYTYAQMKGWKYAVLNFGDTIVVPPTVPIGILSATDCSATYHTFARISHLPLVEAAYRASKDVSLPTMDIRPPLLNWFKYSISRNPSNISTESKRSLFRLLAYEADVGADRFVNQHTVYRWKEHGNKSEYVEDPQSRTTYPTPPPTYKRILVKDVSRVELDVKTREKLLNIIPLMLRVGQGWEFFGWGAADFCGVQIPMAGADDSREEREEFEAALKERLAMALLAQAQAQSMLPSKTMSRL